MTHLSDFSYLERCAIWIYLSVYFIHSIYRSDKFKCLSLKSILAGELKTITTILMILMLILQFMWDIASSYVKYNEGFVDYHGKIITKPFQMWDSSHQVLLMQMDYVECVTFSLEVGVFFLLQSFWNYLSNTVAKKSFMSSFEFKFYIVWALASMAMFPVLQWVYRNDISKREAIPQLAYGVEALLAALLGIRSHFRFKRIIALSEKKNTPGHQAIITKLSYFRDMNIAISIVLASYAISVIILCIDGLTSMVINTNKFAVDCLMANLNVCVIFLWLCLISIFHSRPQYSKAATESSNSRSSFQYSNNPRTHQASEFKSKNTTYTIDETTKGMDDLSPDGKYIVSGSTINNSGGFMRAMSPMTVDHPYSVSSETMPFGSSAGTGRPMSPAAQHNVAIEDPYSNQPVMFSMMDSSAIKQQKQHHVQVNDIPLQGMSPHSMSPPPPPPSMQHHDSFRVDMHPNYEPISPNRARPSWEHSMSQSGQDQIIDDWLWQSPERRNP